MSKLSLLTTYHVPLSLCVFHFLCCDVSHPQVSHHISGRVRPPRTAGRRTGRSGCNDGRTAPSAFFHSGRGEKRPPNDTGRRDSSARQCSGRPSHPGILSAADERVLVRDTRLLRNNEHRRGAEETELIVARAFINHARATTYYSIGNFPSH